ncbi:MAG: sulfatase-like hydrolase/transferase, partial [Candidatus Nanohaloarchaea archaeon]
SSEGYRTACISTNAWLSDRFGLTGGFDRVDNLASSGLRGMLTAARRRMDSWLSSPGHENLKRKVVRLGNRLFHYSGGSQTGNVVEKGLEFVDSGDEPFFLFLNLMDAHEPYFPPEEYLEKHGCAEPSEICQNPDEFYSGRREVDFDEVGKIYDASVDYLDDQLGRLFTELEERGEWEDTVVVLVSDHGQMLGEEGHYGHQYSVDEELVSVPMMVKGADGDEVEKQVELKELYSILLSAAGMQDSYREGTEYAEGGYEFPDVQRPRIPEERWEDLYRRHRFVRSKKGRVTETEDEDGNTGLEFESFSGELEEEEREELERRVKSIGESEEGKQLESKDEEIQQKLKNLGYG